MGRIDGAVQEIKECERCRAALFIVLTKDERVVATDRKSGTQHICFDIPQDANLLVMREEYGT